jgi:FkbM family methyltransferase
MVINRQLADPSAHIVVEANPQLLPLLEQNRKRNGGAFRVCHAAVGDGQPLRMELSSGILTTRQVEGSTGPSVVEVPGCTLAALSSEHGPFTALVMDVEGAEATVLLGSDWTWKALRLIVVEMHPSITGQDAYERMGEELTAAGFRLLDRRDGQTHVVEAWQRETKNL